MNHFKIKIKLLSSLGSKLMADTIWGHICYGILFNEGEDNLKEFLQEYYDINENKSPPLILSTPFPEGLLPVPKFIHKDRPGDIKISEYRNLKKKKKIEYINSRSFFEKELDINKILESIIIEEEKNKKDKIKIETENKMHNIIERSSGTTSEDGIYQSTEYWYINIHEENNIKKYSNAIFDIYVFTIYDKERILKLFKWGLENGYGADSSTGKGNIIVNENIEEFIFPNNGSTAIALAPFILSAEEYEKLDVENGLIADTWTKYPKVHNSMTKMTNPFKKPIIFYKEGATLNFKDKGKKPEYVGKCVDRIHHIPEIMQYAMSPLIWVDIK